MDIGRDYNWCSDGCMDSLEVLEETRLPFHALRLRWTPHKRPDFLLGGCGFYVSFLRPHFLYPGGLPEMILARLLGGYRNILLSRGCFSCKNLYNSGIGIEEAEKYGYNNR